MAVPGLAPEGADPTSPGWIGLNVGTAAFGSSFSPGQSGSLATDDDIRTWWQLAAEGRALVLTSRLASPGEIRAVRVVWRDIELYPLRGVRTGAFGYRIEA